MVSLQIHVHSEPLNVTLFGNRAFADGIETAGLPTLLPMENFSQRISLIRELRNVETKENCQKKLNNNNNVVIKHSQGPLVLSQGLLIIF